MGEPRPPTLEVAFVEQLKDKIRSQGIVLSDRVLKVDALELKAQADLAAESAE